MPDQFDDTSDINTGVSSNQSAPTSTPTPTPTPTTAQNLAAPVNPTQASAVSKMLFPDGLVRAVPNEKVQDAVAAGGKLTTVMSFPDSTQRNVPLDKVHSAISVGGQLSGMSGAAQPNVQVQPMAGRQAPNTMQPVQAETTPAGQAAAIQQRESDQPVVSALGHTAIGFGKGAEESGHTVGRIINAATGDNIGQLPTSFQQPDYLRSDNGFETAGKVGEGVLEFVMGDGALKGLKLAEKMQIAQKLAKVVSDEPYAAKIVEAGLNAARMGLVSGVQTGLHEPNAGSIAAGTVAGFGGGVLGEGLSAGAEALTARTPAARLAAAAQTAAENAREAEEIEASTQIGQQSTLTNAAENAVEKSTGVAPTLGTDLETGVLHIRPGYYSFGDAASAIKDHFGPVFDQLRAESAVEGGINGFDEATNQIKMAKKVLYSPTPTSVESLQSAQKSLEDGEQKLAKVFENSTVKASDLQAAKTGWRRALVLDELHNAIDRSFTVPQAGRSFSGAPGELEATLIPQRYVNNVNKAFRDIGKDALEDAIGRHGAKSLYYIHDAITDAVSNTAKAKKLATLTNIAMRAGAPAGRQALELGAGAGLTTAASVAAHLIGATNPVTAGIMLTGTTLSWLYTHPEQAVTILKMVGRSAPIASQIGKQGVTHLFNPDSKRVEPVTPTPPTTPETAPKQTFGQMDAERLVPAMASVEGGKPTDLNNRLNNPINLVYRGQSGATPYEHNGKVFASFRTKEEGRQAALAQLRLDQSRPEYADLSLEDYINQKHSPDSDPGNGPGQAKAYAAKVHALLGQ